MNALVLPGEARLIGPALRRLRVSLNLNQAHLVAAGVANQGVCFKIHEGGRASE